MLTSPNRYVFCSGEVELTIDLSERLRFLEVRVDNRLVGDARSWLSPTSPGTETWTGWNFHWMSWSGQPKEVTDEFMLGLRTLYSVAMRLEVVQRSENHLATLNRISGLDFRPKAND